MRLRIRRARKVTPAEHDRAQHDHGNEQRNGTAQENDERQPREPVRGLKFCGQLAILRLQRLYGRGALSLHAFRDREATLVRGRRTHAGFIEKFKQLAGARGDAARFNRVASTGVPGVHPKHTPAIVQQRPAARTG